MTFCDFNLHFLRPRQGRHVSAQAIGLGNSLIEAREGWKPDI